MISPIISEQVLCHDLSRLSGAYALAEDVARLTDALDVLVNNAGESPHCCPRLIPTNPNRPSRRV